jgi:hypothetical protein
MRCDAPRPAAPCPAGGFSLIAKGFARVGY